MPGLITSTVRSCTTCRTRNCDGYVATTVRIRILNVLSSNLTRQPTYPNKRVYSYLQPLSFLPNPSLFKHVVSYFLTLFGKKIRYND